MELCDDFDVLDFGAVVAVDPLDGEPRLQGDVGEAVDEVVLQHVVVDAMLSLETLLHDNTCNFRGECRKQNVSSHRSQG